jgi:hypothetical protein
MDVGNVMAAIQSWINNQLRDTQCPVCGKREFKATSPASQLDNDTSVMAFGARCSRLSGNGFCSTDIRIYSDNRHTAPGYVEPQMARRRRQEKRRKTRLRLRLLQPTGSGG